MHPRSCMVGQLQGTAALFYNNPPHYNETTQQHQQMSGYGQPANMLFSMENRLVTNGASNWQNVTPTSGLQPHHFIEESQRNSSLNAHNGQSFLLSGSFPVQNFQTQSSEFNYTSRRNTNVPSKQDMSQLSTQKQRQPVSVQQPYSSELYLLNQRIKAASNLNNRPDKPFTAQTTTTTTTHPREKLKDYTSNRQMVNNVQDSQTPHQQRLSACAQQLLDNFSACQAKTTIPSGIEHGVRHFHNFILNQTSPQHQKQIIPTVSVPDNVTHPKHGHQIRGRGIGFDPCESQTGSSHGRTAYIHKDRTIPLRQTNHNTIHGTLNTPPDNWDAPQSLLPCSGQASTSNACNPSATSDNNNPAFEKKSFKAIAVVQPLEQECCLNQPSKNNSCDTVDASSDKSASDKSSCEFSGVEPSSVTTIPWTIKRLTKLLEDNEKAQQIEVIRLTKVNTSRFTCNVSSFPEINHNKHGLFNLMKTAALFCSRYVTKDCVILTEVKGSYGENHCVLKHGEPYTEPPYKSQWLNVGELDDIDKEFGYASCLKDIAKKQAGQTSEVTSIPAQIVKDDCVKDMTVIEPESTDPGKDIDNLNSLGRRISVEDKATTPSEDSSVDSSDSEFSFEINVLPPDKAKDIYEQIQKITTVANATNKPPEDGTGRSDQGRLSQGGNFTESDKRAQVSHTEYCCLPRYFSTFLKDDTSDSKCQCGSATFSVNNAEKNSTQEKEPSEETSLSPAEGDSDLLLGLNQPVSPKEKKQHCHDSDRALNRKVTACIHNPILFHLLLNGETDGDVSSCSAKIQSNAKVTCPDAASDHEKTTCYSDLKLRERTSYSTEGTEAQSLFSKIPPFEDLATKVKSEQRDEELYHPPLKALKKCSNQVDEKQPCTKKSQEVVVDCSQDEPVHSNESPSAGHPLPCQGKDEDGLSDVELQINAVVDDAILISDREQTCSTISDSLAETQAKSLISEVATAETIAPKINTCLPVEVMSSSPKSPKVSVHLIQEELLPVKEKVVKLRLFGSGSSQKMCVVKRPPNVLSVHLSSLKDGLRKPTTVEDQSAKQRVYEKWKTSLVPFLAVGKRKEGTRKGSSILGVDRERTLYVGSTVTRNVPVRSERWIGKRKPNDIIGLKLKRRKLSSSAKPVKWQGGSAAAPDDRRFRIPTTF